ncbi:MAG TPA: CRISPR-associated protein Csm4, partial [Agitococcus sp.]|nr:CRISPR-associated protein Csm4 [Agitococcus sp.]
TLGNLAPQGHEWDTKNSFYNTTIRFGRHGAEAVYMGNPFKNPTILSTAGAIFTPKEFNNRLFIGQGLNGLSKIITHTVQQGYTPVLPVYLDKKDN